MRRRRPADDANSAQPNVVFEFCVRGPSVSAQAKNRRRLKDWRDLVSREALTVAAAEGPVHDELELWLTEFSDLPTKDRDNMAKPVQDAMQAILFDNDRQILRLEVEWCDINGKYRVRHMSPVVAAALSAGHEFLWVRVVRHLPREALSK